MSFFSNGGAGGGVRHPQLLWRVLSASCLAAIVLLILGQTIHYLLKTAGLDVVVTPEQAAMVPWPEELRPERVERMTFYLTTLLAIPVIAMAIWFVRARMVPSDRSLYSGNDGSLLAPRQGWPVLVLTIALAFIASGQKNIFSLDMVNDQHWFTLHFDAVAYSIYQVSRGSSCLSDLPVQYGCYSEYLAPLWKLVGLTHLTLSATLTLFHVISLLSIMWFLSSLIRNKWLLAICSIVLVGTSMLFSYTDPYFQYWPIRTIFPSIALLLALAWYKKPSMLLTLGLGLYSAAAIGWNLDSGVNVVLMLGTLLVVHKATQASSWRDWLCRERFVHVVIFVAGLFLGLALLVSALSLKAGVWIDPLEYSHSQRIFYLLGYYMLPMPPLPHLWGVVVAIMLCGAVYAGIFWWSNTLDARSELFSVMVVLSLGTFLYYTGRSHIEVLRYLLWAPTILAAAVIDRACPVLHWKRLPAIYRIAATVTLAMFIALFAYRLPGSYKLWTEHLSRPLWPSELVEDGEFIAGKTKPDEAIALFSLNQASLAMASGRKIGLHGPGLVETVLWDDFRQMMKELRNDGPPHVFVQARFLGSEKIIGMYAPDVMAVLKEAYQAESWSPDGRLLHLVKRTDSGSSKVSFERPEFVNGGIKDFPLIVADHFPPGKVTLEVKLNAESWQPDNAVLAHSTIPQSTPPSGFVLFHVPGEQDMYALTIREKDTLKTTPKFRIPSGVTTTVSITWDAPALDVVVDGQKVFSSTEFGYMENGIGVVSIGDFRNNPDDRPSSEDYKRLGFAYGIKTGWSAIDHRFRGTVMSARMITGKPL